MSICKNCLTVSMAHNDEICKEPVFVSHISNDMIYALLQEVLKGIIKLEKIVWSSD